MPSGARTNTMGRYDFRPARVLHAANLLLEAQRIRFKPTWYDAVSHSPPGETVVRPAHRFKPTSKRDRRRKPSRMFQPLTIKYPEDELRTTFFHDHPWELARPKVVLEDTGNDAKHWDWSRIDQNGKKLDGESVVQRQMWLINEECQRRGGEINAETMKAIEEQAYDKARKEFYKLRLEQDAERQVAKEEALHYFASFEKSEIERSIPFEDDAYEEWKNYALKELDEQTQKKNALLGQSTADMEGEEEARVASEIASQTGGTTSLSGRGTV